MAEPSAPTPNPDDLDASLERMVDDALADPESALAGTYSENAPPAVDPSGAGAGGGAGGESAGDSSASDARAEAESSMSDVVREMQQRLREQGASDEEPAQSPPEKIAPEQIASLDEQLAGAAPELDVAGDFESVDAAIGQIFDTRASVVQRAGQPAEVRDFPEAARSRKSGGGGVRFQKPTAEDDDEDANFEPVAPPSRAKEAKSDEPDDAPVAGVFEDVEVATAPQGVVASEERFTAFAALPLHHDEVEKPGPLKRVFIVANAPLKGRPTQWRSLMGIAAVMTLFNAACLWAWILLR